MKIKIGVYLATTPVWGGSHQYAQAIISALAQLNPKKYDVRVLCVDNDSWDEFLSAKLKLHFNYNPPHYLSKYRFKLFWYSLFNKKKATLLLEKQAPHNFQRWSPQIYIVPQQLTESLDIPNTKLLTVIHDLMHRYETQFAEIGLEDVIEKREKICVDILKHAHTILVDSNIGKKHVYACDTHVRAKIEILPFTVFENQMPKDSRMPVVQTPVAETPVAEIVIGKLPEKFFFYPAQFWEHKNHVRLAEALHLCKEKYPELCKDMHFILTGGIEQNGYDAFQKCVQKLNIEKHFSVLGYVEPEEIVWLYENARALIMPTFFGPTNIPPLEAFSKGCPVAISDIYGHREECGDAALYFDPKDSASIAETLYQLWTDDTLYGTLSQKGLERAKNWTEKDFQDRFLEILKNIQIDN